MYPTRLSTMALTAIALLTALPAHAEDRSPTPPPAKATRPAPSTTDMSGADMQKLMADCAEMREQMKQGKPMSGDAQSLMQRCDQMDKQMPMPSATKSR